MTDNLPLALGCYGIFILSGTVHEVLHGWSALRLGDPTARDSGRVNFNPLVHLDPIGTVLFPLINMFYGGLLIGWMRPVPVVPGNLNSPKKHFLIVSLAGPFANLLLGTAGAFLFSLIPWSYGSSDSTMALFLLYWIRINFFLAIFNLLPIPPLDGSSIVDFLRRDSRGTYHSQGGGGFILLYVILFLGGFNLIGAGVTHVTYALVFRPLVAGSLLALLLGTLILFAIKTASRQRPKREAPAKRKSLPIFDAAKKLAEKLRLGEDLSSRDQELLDTLRKDEGDGKPLCSAFSFDERNALCPPCPNFKRCLLRMIEEKKPGD